MQLHDRPHRPLRAASARQIADRLRSATAAAGGSRNSGSIQLTAVATGVILLGAGEDLAHASIRYFANSRTSLADLAELWTAFASKAPLLHGHLEPLTGWLTDPHVADPDVAVACFDALAGVDLLASATAPAVDGELLGRVYTHLRSLGDRQATGAFYTPAPINRLIAAMALPREHDQFLDPACGTGGMAIAAARAMRAHGQDPTTCTWVLNDIDPLAVALAGVNAVVHNLGPHVVLHRGDGLRLTTAV